MGDTTVAFFSRFSAWVTSVCFALAFSSASFMSTWVVWIWMVYWSLSEPDAQPRSFSSSLICCW